MRRRRSPKRVLIIIFSLVVFIGLLYLLDYVLRPTFLAIVNMQAVQIATDAANEAILHTLVTEHVEYSDLIEVHRDSEGRVDLLQANTVRISEIAAEVALAVQKSLTGLRTDPLDVPLGQILGIQLLASRGPVLRMYIIPVGTVLTHISDKFQQAGVNQTKHTIYLDLSTSVRVVVPLFQDTVQVSTQMPIAESIIVGTVPNVFVNLPGGLLGYGGK